MKKFLFIFLTGLLLASVSQAQKIGYIDSNFILSKIPDYNKVQQEMDKYAEAWQKEIEQQQQQVDQLKQDYKAEEVLLTEEMKRKRQAEIAKKETEMRDYQRKVFGYEGMMFRRRQELMRPIQDKVFEAVEKVSKAKRVDFMIDKSGELLLIYTNPVHDYTEYVLEELGLVSDRQNTTGSQPASGIVDDPNNLPEIDVGEQQEATPAPPAKGTKKKSNN
ncbi:periplasmic chaperone for outer membrane proteins Skp [Pontibacter ummariensis]|uniref:Periplasmic chaperone for outer membrane proteins Skp n=1 Tax=Pontibacter ummariensis TaxID=1610492 RepID=A0A239K611_9BACT|nr:OmpH family outer membrane protein [Pontibacter ummariensis]PRY06021.1 periplasmic chaperone for outer membrane proteins Skp [Pontibacter ummariensis]SNT13896.1 periplasmic chaperone for outer membrane proteins Skp [Pontibacter ummariensis]